MLWLIVLVLKALATIVVTTIAAIFLGELSSALTRAALFVPTARPSIRGAIGLIVGGWIGNALAVYGSFWICERMLGLPPWPVLFLSLFSIWAIVQATAEESAETDRTIDPMWPMVVCTGTSLGMLAFGQRYLSSADEVPQPIRSPLVRSSDWSPPTFRQPPPSRVDHGHVPPSPPRPSEVYGSHRIDWQYDTQSEWAEKDYRDRMREDFAR